MSTSDSPATQNRPLNPLRWHSLAAVCILLGLVWVVCDGFVIAIPAIGRTVGGSTDAMAWAVNGFSLWRAWRRSSVVSAICAATGGSSSPEVWSWSWDPLSAGWPTRRTR